MFQCTSSANTDTVYSQCIHSANTDTVYSIQIWHIFTIQCKHSVYSVQIQCILTWVPFPANTVGCAQSWCGMAAAGQEQMANSPAKWVSPELQLLLGWKNSKHILTWHWQFDLQHGWGWVFHTKVRKEWELTREGKRNSPFHANTNLTDRQSDRAKYFAALHRGRISLLRQPDSPLLDGCTGSADQLCCCCCSALGL